MNLNVPEKALLRDILDMRIKELESAPNYWTGKTSQKVISAVLQETEDTKSLKKVLLGED